MVLQLVCACLAASLLRCSLGSNIVWTDARTVGVRGRGSFSGERLSYYDRLPAEAKGKVRDAVWGLSTNTAGMYVQFRTCSSHLQVNVSYTSSGMTMWHFPSTGVAGLDLYAWDQATSSWRWTSTTREMEYPTSVNSMTALPTNTTVRYRLHLPLYNGVRNLSIGHTSDCPLEQDEQEYRQVVWYGTSIAQGGVASRPGQAFTNWIARRIDHEILNFGFSGNGIMELSVAQYLVQIPDPALFVIDCSWNMAADLIQKNTVPLVNFIRKYHPSVPIVLAEDTAAGAAWLQTNSYVSQQQKRQALRAGYEQLVAAGTKDLFYVFRESLFNFTAPEDKLLSPTVGGCHPTDLGMKAITDFYVGFLPPILAANRPAFKDGAQIVDVPTLSPAQLHEEVEAAKWGRQDPQDTTADKSTWATAWQWTDMADLGIMGRAFNDTPTIFNRLPVRAKGVVRDAVWGLGLYSTGLFVAFTTNAKAIAINYTLTEDAQPLWHMPSSGTSGADLWRFDEVSGTWGFINCLRSYPAKGQEHVEALFSDLPVRGNASRYLLFLPLRKAVAWGHIGVNEGAQPARRDEAFATDGITFNGRRPVVWYGTSIDQGGVVSRPGHTYTNILTRNLGRMVLNFGFAGNGKMETDVAQFLTEIDAELIVIDCLWNMGPSLVVNNTGPLVRFFRQRHPDTSILLVAGTRAGKYWFDPSYNDNLNAALKSEYDKLVAAGDKHLYLMENAHDELYGSDESVNPTVGGTHPTDLGHWEIASFYTKYLQKFLPDTPRGFVI